MKLIRFVDEQGQIRNGVEEGGGVWIAEGEFPSFTKTEQPAQVAQLLAPILPRQIIGIGQNYAKHAAESNSPIPKIP